MARSVWVVDPQDPRYCMGQDSSAPTQRQHVWDAHHALTEDTEFKQVYMVTYTCVCGDEYVEMLTYDNTLSMEMQFRGVGKHIELDD